MILPRRQTKVLIEANDKVRLIRSNEHFEMNDEYKASSNKVMREGKEATEVNKTIGKVKKHYKSSKKVRTETSTHEFNKVE